MALIEFMDYGNAPEFFVTDVGAREDVGDFVRLYICARRDGVLILQYTAVWPIAALLKASSEVVAGAASQSDIVIRAAH